MNQRQLNHLNRHVQKDELYRELVQIRSQFEPDYRRVLLALPPEDRWCIESYIRFSHAAEERITRTAYFMTPTR